VALNLDQKRAERARSRAARREGENPTGVSVLFDGKDYLLPVELPAAVLDPLVDGDLDLAGLIKVAYDASRDQSRPAESRDEMQSLIWETLAAKPDLPVSVIRAIRDSLALLFGADQWASFQASEPSLADMGALVVGLVSEYGVGLGEALRSGNSSKTDGTTSNPTSSVTAAVSTLDGSGPTPILAAS
jgi:hypothetical protein